VEYLSIAGHYRGLKTASFLRYFPFIITRKFFCLVAQPGTAGPNPVQA
jgi:hypothetical protein